MGFRFRKSIKLGPVRVNLSKSGVGYSVGGKGLRFTKKAGGGTRTTASIPGTGISYVKDSSNKKQDVTAIAPDRSSTSTPKIKKGWIWAAVLACLALLGACNDDSAHTTVPTEPPAAAAIVETTLAPTNPVDAVTEATSQTADEIAKQESTSATVPTTDATTEPTTEPTTAPTTVPTEPEAEIHTYVLNTKTKKFHYDWCSSVKDMKEANKKILETTREDVISRGYEPCGRCHP